MKILNERLDALERDNIEDEEGVNESDLYDEDEDVSIILLSLNFVGSCGATKKAERIITSQVTVILLILVDFGIFVALCFLFLSLQK